MSIKEKPIKQDDRNSIIVNNFFKYLKEKGISNSQYAKDNFIDKSLLTQWKNGSTRMTMEHVFNASKYFNVTVNDLIYDDDEKKNIEVLEDTSYSPIKASEIKIVKSYDYNSYKIFFILYSLFFIFFILMVYLIRDYPYFLIIESLLGIIGMAIFLHYTFINKKTYIINYLDDIYYKIDDTKNKNRKERFIIGLSIILGIIIKYILFMIYNDSLRILYFGIWCIIFGLVLDTFCLLFCFICLFSNPKEYKKEVYFFELDVYMHSIYVFILSLLSFFCSIAFFLAHNNVSTIYILPTLTTSILSFIQFIIIHKKYKNYYLAYNEGGKKEHKL